ncbi:MAG: hypothetical protein ACI9KE_001040 [Polyangiales bacterium]|jgi:hypothetical protein
MPAKLAILVLVLTTVAGCGRTRYQVETQGQVYSLTTLHADARGRISSVNYTNGTRIPICTPVEFGAISSRQARFTHAQTGQRFTYTMHRSARTPIDQQMARNFGTACPNTAAMSPEDQAGIQQGQVFPGMTKQGVIMAAGYPPEHRTPSLQQDTWRYWGSRNRTFEVHFVNGVVAEIQ